MRLPFCESLFEHINGDLKQVAAWIFGCLDTEPPEGGKYVAFYLCYHSSDYSFFSRLDSANELKDHLFRIYRNEKNWDGKGFGNLRFDLEYNRKKAHMALVSRKRRPDFFLKDLFLARNNSISPGPGIRPSEVDFYWIEADKITRPGTLGLIRCSREKLRPDDKITGYIRFEGDAVFSKHLDICQNRSRWQQPVIYLPDTRTEISVGDKPGCDVRIASLEPMIISYEKGNFSRYDDISGSPQKQKEKGGSSLDIEVRSGTTQSDVFIQCRRIIEPRLLKDFEIENRLPFFSVKVVGCVFPKLHNDRGYIPNDFPAKYLRGINSVLRLPGNKWLYLLHENSNPYFLHADKILEIKDGVEISLEDFPSNGKRQKGIWVSENGSDTEAFHKGEFQFSPGLVSDLAAGPGKGEFPGEYFVDYSDIALGKSPIDLISQDGRRFFLKFKKGAQQMVFLTDESLQITFQIGPETQKEIDIGNGADFILGTTHYQLAHTSMSNNSDSTI